MTKREMVLERCRVAGYNGDKATYTRIALESNRVTFEDKRNARRCKQGSKSIFRFIDKIKEKPP